MSVTSGTPGRKQTWRLWVLSRNRKPFVIPTHDDFLSETRHTRSGASYTSSRPFRSKRTRRSPIRWPTNLRRLVRSGPQTVILQDEVTSSGVLCAPLSLQVQQTTTNWNIRQEQRPSPDHHTTQTFLSSYSRLLSMSERYLESSCMVMIGIVDVALPEVQVTLQQHQEEPTVS